MYDPKTVLAQLLSQPLLDLASLPSTHGIYALSDHKDVLRYIGVTKSQRMGFYNRIHNYHVTGSTGRSHKFSHAYNCGRMFAVRKDESPSATAARSLRATFCRAHCKAAFVEIRRDHVPGDYFVFLRKLEAQVQVLAPPHMRSWEGLHFVSLPEPTMELDSFLKNAYSGV